jgi:steroid delta-isomerase-like uncharacterized protein
MSTPIKDHLRHCRAYSLTEVAVLDEEAAGRYAELTGPAVAKYGGRVLVLAGAPTVAEGTAPPGLRLVIIEWPSREHLDAWYTSPEYAPAREIAASALLRRLRFVDGLADAEQPAETTVRRFYEALSTGDTSAAEEFLAAEWEGITLLPGTARGPEGYRQTVAFLRAAFPDLAMEIEEILVAGDRVAVRSTAHGTHRGEIMGVAPTGRRVAFRAYDFHRLADGKIVQSWHLEDFPALRERITAESVAVA